MGGSSHLVQYTEPLIMTIKVTDARGDYTAISSTDITWIYDKYVSLNSE